MESEAPPNNFRAIGPYAARFVVWRDGRAAFVRAADVDWIESDANYVVFHIGKDSYRVRTTLQALVDCLDPRQFVRVHKSAIVNVDSVREIQAAPTGDYVCFMRRGDEIRIGRTFASDVLRQVR